MHMLIAALLCVSAAAAEAFQPAPPVAPFAATGTIQYAFSPDDHADSMIIAAINAAQSRVLMLAYSLTHRRITDALIHAKRRGLDVAVIVDQGQAHAHPAMTRELARGGVPLLFDAHHSAAHNKVIILDPGYADCAVVTGSFNFTYAAQRRNAENVLVLRGNPPLCDAYFNNWRRHQSHSRPLSR